ncbi:MAG: beta-ketoacyl-[acyl-carrier-protein] synthase family protein [Phycisphaerales bacterium]|nr:MAG: beta-ketoacyl-[acyl-carrier-protein] synthase family protein [Phycisphaerales bacterium]
MGWVTPLGVDIDETWARLIKGESGVGPVTRFNAASFSTNFAAQSPDVRIEDELPRPEAHAHAGLNTRFALVAAMRAWKQAGLGDPDRAEINRNRFGMYLGSGEGALDHDNFFATSLASWNSETGASDPVAWARAAYKHMDARREIEQEPNMCLAHICEAFGAAGPAYNCMTACAASTQAIGEATEVLRRGDADMMFAGGAHSMIHPLGMTGFIRLTAMSSRSDEPHTAARPFDATRDGFVMGEGAGMLLLETLEHARARGATPLAEIAGYGSSADAFRITDIQPEGVGAQAAMREALHEAGIDPERPDAQGRPPVQYISAHGTGTKENDSIETKAVKAVFAQQAPRIPFSSVKSMIGHLIQAAGAVELITCVQAIRTGVAPPTMNLHHPDSACDLDYVPNAARDMRAAGGVDVCLSNSFGFGGQNDTIIVKRFAD